MNLRSIVLLGLGLGASMVGCTTRPPSHNGLAHNNSANSKSANNDPTPSQSATIEFVDATEQFGLHSVYRDGSESNNLSILEGLGGGVGMLDYDNDGQLDLFFPSGGTLRAGQAPRGLPSTLWRNQAGQRLSNVSQAAKVEQAPYYSHGVACADVDNDGFVDLLLTGYGGLQFFHNQGDGTFLECAAELGLNDNSWSTSAGWFDLNRDGNLDLFVVHYVDWSWDKHPRCGSPTAPDRCAPYQFNGLRDAVFLSDGKGGFSDVSSTVGLVDEGKGLGVVAADFDGDGACEVYVANDTTNNFFYQSTSEGQLEETGLFNGTALDQRGIPNGSMGLAVTDFNLDHQPDLWVTNFENETCAMYQNAGGTGFRCVSNSIGVNALGKVFVGFGTVAADLDHDGYEDLVVANGHIQTLSPMAQEQLLLRNEQGKKLVRVTYDTGYFARAHVGRGLVGGDMDGDGRIDLVFSNSMEPAAIELNRSPTGEASWVGLQLIGTTSSRDPIGARIELRSGDVQRTRYVVGGGSYLSQGPYRVHWGLPESDAPLSATIHWPSGKLQTISKLSHRTLHLVVEHLVVENDQSCHLAPSR